MERHPFINCLAITDQNRVRSLNFEPYMLKEIAQSGKFTSALKGGLPMKITYLDLQGVSCVVAIGDVLVPYSYGLYLEYVISADKSF